MDKNWQHVLAMQHRRKCHVSASVQTDNPFTCRLEQQNEDFTTSEVIVIAFQEYMPSSRAQCELTGMRTGGWWASQLLLQRTQLNADTTGGRRTH